MGAPDSYLARRVIEALPGDLSETSDGLLLTLPTEHVWSPPGLQELLPYEPEDPAMLDQPFVWGLTPGFTLGEQADNETLLVTLWPEGRVIQLDVEVTEPAPMRFSGSKRWKKAPPSRRRHMKSWRFASEHEKARYAPLAKKDRRRWPWWAWHPDHGRRQWLGSVIVRQVLTVYAQRGADLKDLLRRYSHDWCQRVARACRLSLEPTSGARPQPEYPARTQVSAAGSAADPAAAC